jgi:hypothetical protein
MISIATRMRATCLLACLVVLPQSAWATLGGNRATVESDQSSLRASRESVDNGPYSVQAITLPNGTGVREYVDTNGQVFGVAWSGPFVPDLKQLYGTYFDSFVSGAQAVKAARHGARGPLNIDQTGTSGLMVQSGGHMGDYSGRAWLPAQLPSGVSADVIQ